MPSKTKSVSKTKPKPITTSNSTPDKTTKTAVAQKNKNTKSAVISNPKPNNTVSDDPNKKLLTTLKTKTTKAYNKFMKEYKNKIGEVYAGKTEQKVPTRYKQHLYNDSDGDKFKNDKPYELIQFPEISNLSAHEGQIIIGKLETHLINIIKKDAAAKGFKTLNKTGKSTGGQNDKGDLQKLYLIIENK